MNKSYYMCAALAGLLDEKADLIIQKMCHCKYLNPLLNNLIILQKLRLVDFLLYRHLEVILKRNIK